VLGDAEADLGLVTLKPLRVAGEPISCSLVDLDAIRAVVGGL
jgi:hypothetical protein